MRKVLPTAGAGALRQEHLGEEGARAVLERACGVSGLDGPRTGGQGLLELPCEENRRGRLESG